MKTFYVEKLCRQKELKTKIHKNKLKFHKNQNCKASKAPSFIPHVATGLMPVLYFINNNQTQNQ